MYASKPHLTDALVPQIALTVGTGFENVLVPFIPENGKKRRPLVVDRQSLTGALNFRM